jgi:L-amino acid N-acyltransferase YncA
VIILPAAISHLPAIVHIYNEAINRRFETADLQTFTVEEKMDWFTSHDQLHPIAVKMEGEKVVGWYSLSAYRRGRKAFSGVRELSYYVHSDWQGKGIGKELVTHAIATARQMNVENLVAIVLDRNERSIGLLKHFNFQQWGLLPDLANFDGERCAHAYFGLKL